jgi:hypothetical protein
MIMNKPCRIKCEWYNPIKNECDSPVKEYEDCEAIVMQKENKKMEARIKELENLAEEMIADFCHVCKVHNPQHKDCTSCAQIEGYKEMLESEEE